MGIVVINCISCANYFFHDCTCSSLMTNNDCLTIKRNECFFNPLGVIYYVIHKSCDLHLGSESCKQTFNNSFCKLLGQGLNTRKNFNFKLAMVKMCSTWLLLNKYALWKNVTLRLLYDLCERQKIYNFNLIQIQIFNFDLSLRLYRSENPLKFFRAYLFTLGQTEHILAMEILQLKLSLFCTPPYCTLTQCCCHISSYSV